MSFEEQVAELVSKRNDLETPLERILFDNDPSNGPIEVRLAAMIESDKS